MAVSLTITEENGLSVVNNPVVIEVVNATAPEGGGGGVPDPHASTHGAAGSDPVALSGTQITSGTVAPARLGTGTPTVYTYLDGTGAWTDNVPVLVPCKNTSAVSISKGAPVYATGTVGATSVIEVAAADADNAAAMPAIGLATVDMAVNATGYVTVVGTLTGLDTNAYTVNQALYVSTTAGQLTATKPTGTSELIQNIGRVTRVGTNTGEVLVLGPGRTNDVPNAIDAAKLTSGTVATARLASTGTASASTFLRGDQSWATPPTIATDSLWDAAGDLAVGSGADTAAKLAKGTTRQVLKVGSSTLEWDAGGANNHPYVTATESGAFAETVPGGAGFGAISAPGASGVLHLHAIWLEKNTTITYITFVSGATAAGTPTNQWFVLCDSSRTALRYTANDTSTAWNSSTAKRLALSSTYTTTYTGKHYVGCLVTATTMPSFRGANAGTFTGVLTDSFTSTSGLTTVGSEGTTFASAVARVATVLGIVS